MFEVGRVCVKTAGREAGRYCVIVKKLDPNYVLITGPRPLVNVRRRKCNIDHLEPLDAKLKISSDASDSEVLKAFEKDLLDRLKLKKPTPEEIRAAKELRAVKEAKKRARAEKEAKERKKEVKKPKVKSRVEKKAEKSPKERKKGGKKKGEKTKKSKPGKPKAKKS